MPLAVCTVLAPVIEYPLGTRTGVLTGARDVEASQYAHSARGEYPKHPWVYRLSTHSML